MHTVVFDVATDVPHPVLLNCWKHHAGALRQRIQACAQVGPAALDDLAKQIVVIGTELMDVYVGDLSPREIAHAVLHTLQTDELLTLPAYRDWLEADGGYRVLTFHDDTQWVLRLGEEDNRYVHVHPARWAPQTLRVRANVLKTAIMVAAYAALQGGDVADVRLVNRVRQRYLGLSPIGRMTDGQGLANVIDVLRM